MVLLGNKNVGDIVKINENGVLTNFIIVHKGKPSSMYDDSCDGVWLLRKTAHSKEVWSADNKNDYENSDIKAWLNGTYLNTIDEKIRKVIKTVKIPCQKGLGTSKTVISGANGLSCKAFLLSGYELGLTTSEHQYLPVDGAVLTYFNGEDAKTKRIGYDSDGTAIYWWLRSPLTYNDINVWDVMLSGSINYDIHANSTSRWVRPAFVLPTSVLVNSDDTLSTNSLPVVSGDKPNGSDLGELSEPPHFTHIVTDEDSSSVTVSEYIDNVLTRSFSTATNKRNPLGALDDAKVFQKILNGRHTAKVIANDGKDDGEPYSVSFNKQVRTAVVMLETPLKADDVISAAVISVAGVIPRDAELRVLVTNNALDSEPIWEDMTQDYEKRVNHVFSNRTAKNGFAFNFKVTVKRGASEEEGFIEKIGGAFD